MTFMLYQFGTDVFRLKVETGETWRLWGDKWELIVDHGARDDVTTRV